jgi:hypothetical protein
LSGACRWRLRRRAAPDACPRPAAASAVRSFHKQRCAAGWLTGLGSKTSSLFAAACTRAQAPDVGVAAFARAAALGLALSPDTNRRLIAAAAQQARAVGVACTLPSSVRATR